MPNLKDFTTHKKEKEDKEWAKIHAEIDTIAEELLGTGDVLEAQQKLLERTTDQLMKTEHIREDIRTTLEIMFAVNGRLISKMFNELLAIKKDMEG